MVMQRTHRSRVAIACQGGGSHTVFSAGVLHELLVHLPEEVDVVALSGTSGGAMCATLAWDGVLRNDPQRASRQLQLFWESMAASKPIDAIVNIAMQNLVNMRDRMILPEVSPYSFPPWGQDKLRDILNQQLNFEELRELARRPGAPALLIGAVEVRTGHFVAFSGKDLRVEFLLASAAFPELFPAVVIPDWGVYWDGLFSQNPPIHDLTDYDIDELWVIQINPSGCDRVPSEIHEINDRRNELAGNISLEQELRLIEMMNRLLATGKVNDAKYHPIQVKRILLDRDLGHASKLDRRPAFLEELREYGKSKARVFLRERQRSSYTLQTQQGNGLAVTEGAAFVH